MAPVLRRGCVDAALLSHMHPGLHTELEANPVSGPFYFHWKPVLQFSTEGVNST